MLEGPGKMRSAVMIAKQTSFLAMFFRRTKKREDPARCDLSIVIGSVLTCLGQAELCAGLTRDPHKLTHVLLRRELFDSYDADT